MEKARRDIRALSLDELRHFFTSHSAPAFKGNQVYEWLWNKGAHDFLGMTNLSKSHRSLLEEYFVINHITSDQLQRRDDGTIKNTIRLHDGYLGGEESFGFMVGDFVRDKDAVLCGEII